MGEERQSRALPPGAPQAGEVFAEKYRVEGVLGVGGMGYVLAATHLSLRERVAIKMLLPERATQPETVARFLREGRAAVRIRSEHVARVLDVDSSADVPYIVMEYLEGADLAEIIRQQRGLPVEKAVDYLLQACEAIAEAHAMQTVHRDLKPGNLFVTQRPDGSDCIKVLDFGISKTVSSDEDGAMTKTSTAIGTPLYMSPEQLKSAKNVDARTDIWALGIILFEMLAGRPPFRADSIAELSVQVLTMNAPDVRKYVPEVAEDLAAAIARCLRRDVRERFPSIAELADALGPHGTAAARESARRISQVLANVSRPEFIDFVPGRPEGDDAPSLTSSALVGTETAETWGSATGVPARDPRTTSKGRSRPVGKWVAGATLALVTVGVGGGALVGRIVRRSDRASVTSVGEKSIPAAPSAPTSGAPARAALGAAAPEPAISAPARPSGSAAPALESPTARRSIAGQAPRRAVAPKAAPTPSAVPHATERSTTTTPPAPVSAAAPTRANDGFTKGRFDSD